MPIGVRGDRPRAASTSVDPHGPQVADAGAVRDLGADPPGLLAQVPKRLLKSRATLCSPVNAIGNMLFAWAVRFGRHHRAGAGQSSEQHRKEDHVVRVMVSALGRRYFCFGRSACY